MKKYDFFVIFHCKIDKSMLELNRININVYFCVFIQRTSYEK